MSEPEDPIVKALRDAARADGRARFESLVERTRNDDARRVVRDEARGECVEEHVEETGVFYMLCGRRLRVGDVIEVETELGWLALRVERAGDAHDVPLCAVHVRGGPRVAVSMKAGVFARFPR